MARLDRAQDAPFAVAIVAKALTKSTRKNAPPPTTETEAQRAPDLAGE
ncbi:hypothetical protein J2Z19_002278 [Ensifer adhaerens]|uniref:Uncharacterized protein n=1 Tax=Ensifer adhaerens TaxID=106592 RepID=A0ACC5SUL5_ENSAD|nr:hypothetical protein [Ensifer adhaerens]MBP1872566.1 hypothetical protein [Ensifer adhaerens]